MQKYKCIICNYSSSRSLNLTRHNNSKKHLKNINEYELKNHIDASSKNKDFESDAYSNCSNDANNEYSNDALIEKNDTDDLLKKYKCKKCNTQFLHHQNYYRHINKTCKYIDDGMMINFNKTVDNSNTNTKRKKVNSQYIKSNKVKDSKSENVIKIMSEKDKKIDRLLQENEKIRKENEQIKKDSEKRLEQIAKEKDDIIEIAKNTAITSKNTSETNTKSLSMLKCAMKHFRNAPPIKQLDGKSAMKLITYEPEKKVNGENEHSIEEIIIFKYSKGILVDFVGDIIICCYRKDNPKYQSMWNTDYARLAFIIKQFIGKDGESEWVKDPNGLKVLKLIIIPIYDKIREMLHDYVRQIHKDISTTGMGYNNINKLMKNSETALTIIGLLSMNKIKKDTLRYISTNFGFDATSINSLNDYDSPEDIDLITSDSEYNL